MSLAVPADIQAALLKQAAENRRIREAMAGRIIAAMEAGDGEMLYEIGTCDDFWGAWHLVFHRISKDAVPDISPTIKEAFQQVWLEHKQMALAIGSPKLLCRPLRRLMPPYDGPPVTLYRGATLHGWRRGVSWTADIEVARRFLLPNTSAATPVIVKTLAQPEAIICKIEYPEPFTEQEKTELRAQHPTCRFAEYHDEIEYLVDPERITAFEIIDATAC